MTQFIHVEQPTQHPGVARAERAFESLQQMARGFDGARGAATLLLAAVVSALLVVANQVVDTWTEGHLMAAWIVMWTLAFAALALFATPARRAVLGLGALFKQWNAARIQSNEDAKIWEVALTDARVMADISRAMDGAVHVNASARAQRLMRSYY